MNDQSQLTLPVFLMEAMIIVQDIRAMGHHAEITMCSNEHGPVVHMKAMPVTNEPDDYEMNESVGSACDHWELHSALESLKELRDRVKIHKERWARVCDFVAKADPEMRAALRAHAFKLHDLARSLK